VFRDRRAGDDRAATSAADLAADRSRAAQPQIELLAPVLFRLDFRQEISQRTLGHTSQKT
jgi:hypothetical protein